MKPRRSLDPSGAADMLPGLVDNKPFSLDVLIFLTVLELVIRDERFRQKKKQKRSWKL